MFVERCEETVIAVDEESQKVNWVNFMYQNKDTFYESSLIA